MMHRTRKRLAEELTAGIQAELAHARESIGEWQAPHLDRYRALHLAFVRRNHRQPTLKERSAMMKRARKESQ